MIEKNTKKNILNKSLIIIGCIVLSIAFAFGLKTVIDYQGNSYNEERPYGEGSQTESCLPGYSLVDGACKVCSDGYFCAGGTTEPRLCEIGHYCLDGDEYECGTGEYQNETGQSTCKPCTAGYVCDTEGLVRPEKTCPAGYYCPEGTSSPIGCPAGAYCQSGVSAPTYCEGNTYNHSTGATSSDACKTCSGTVNASKTECIITVRPESIEINANNVMHVGGTMILNTTVKPSNASQVVEWTILEGAENVTLVGNSLNAIKAGNVKLQVTAKALSTVKNEITITIKESESLTISVTPKDIYLAKGGDNAHVVVRVTDSEGNPIENPSLSIQHDESKATVVNDGFNSNTKYSNINNTSKNEGGSGSGYITDTVTVCLTTSVNTDEPKCDTYNIHIYCNAWVESGGGEFDDYLSKGYLHNNPGCAYVTSDDCTEKEGTTGKLICTKSYNRCCGTGGGTPTTEEPACYEVKSTGKYEWGKFKNDDRYKLVTNIKTANECVNEAGTGDPVYACYKDANNNYEWAVTAPEGYEIVESVKDQANCKLIDDAACYKDADGKYAWGDYANNSSYKLIETIKTAEKCVNPDGCYKDSKGNFVWGNYAYNNAYTFISNITSKDKCGDSVKVPATGASTTAIVYMSIIIMLISGGSFVYYVYSKKKLG